MKTLSQSTAVRLIALAITRIRTLLTFSAVAEDETEVGRAPSRVMVGIETDGSGGNESYGKNMVRNPYYQKYYNDMYEK